MGEETKPTRPEPAFHIGDAVLMGDPGIYQFPYRVFRKPKWDRKQGEWNYYLAAPGTGTWVYEQYLMAQPADAVCCQATHWIYNTPGHRQCVETLELQLFTLDNGETIRLCRHHPPRAHLTDFDSGMLPQERLQAWLANDRRERPVSQP